MKLEIKSVYLKSISLFFLLRINTICSMEYTTLSTTLESETINHNFDLKCLTDFEYNILIESFIRQIVKEIQLNHSSEAMETLRKISSDDDDRFVQDIVTEALEQPDVKLLYLLEFIN